MRKGDIPSGRDGTWCLWRSGNGREDGTWYLSEVNPRFGGGYPHAYASGVNFAKMLVNNLSGKENEEQTGAYEEGICMMKYNDVCIRREEELVK